jgi:hypothetical protein
MKQKKEKEQQEKGLSRRGVIKAVAGGLAASAVAGLTPVKAALQARTTRLREKELLECTVGNTVRILMDPEVKEPPDVAAIYRGLGGKAQFTIRLLAETFGSRSMRVEGTYPLRAHTAPDLTAMTKALETKALELVDKKVPGVAGRPVRNADAGRGTQVVWIFESSPRFKASCHVESS